MSSHGLLESATTIDSVPDDVLLQIFEVATDEDPDWPVDYSNGTESTRVSNIHFLRVCRRWHVVGRHLSFQRLNISLGNESGNKSLYRLHHALETKRELRIRMRFLSIDIDGRSDSSMTHMHLQLLQILKWAKPSLKRLLISGTLESPLFGSIMQAFLLTGLGDFDIDKPPFLKIQKHVPSYNIKKFLWHSSPESITYSTMHGPRLQVGSTLRPVDPWTETSATWETYQHAGALMSVTIVNPNTGMKNVKLLLQWPKASDPLSTETSKYSTYAHAFPLTMISSSLAHHAHTLQHISLRHLNSCLHVDGDIPSFPDFSDYSQLETLALSTKTVFVTAPPVACDRLAAPKLRKLMIDFDNDENRSLGPDECSEDVRDWFVHFAHVWTTRYPALSLNHIRLAYSPTYFMTHISPWRHMADAREELQKCGIQLTWPFQQRN